MWSAPSRVDNASRAAVDSFMAVATTGTPSEPIGGLVRWVAIDDGALGFPWESRSAIVTVELGHTRSTRCNLRSFLSVVAGEDDPQRDGLAGVQAEIANSVRGSCFDIEAVVAE